MKFIPVVLCLSVFRAAAAESCPDELPGKVELNGAGLALHYGILETDQALCGKLVSNTEAWVGFAAQPEGVEQMVGARSIIALPSANTVQQYMLNAKNTEGIVPSENQSLTETSVTQEDGTTVATFKQLLSDDGFELTSNNVYLLAKGFSNNLGYHANRGFVALDFENNVITSPTASPTLQPSLPLQSSSPPSSHSSPQPSSQPSQKTSTQSSSKPSSRPSLGSTGAPSSGNFSSTTSPTTTPLVTTNTTSYPSSQPSSVPPSQSTSIPSSRPSIGASSRPSNLSSADPSSQNTSSPSSVPSSQPTNQTLDTSSPSSASSSQLTSDPSSKPSPNPSPEQSVPASISEDNDPTSSSERKVVSLALGAAACLLFATLCC